jgi:Kef-type K+ transport system membrane component KefB
MDLKEFDKILFFGLLIALMTIIGKTLGAGLGAKLTGLNNRNALKVGYAMIPIGMVANLIAGIAKDAGIIGYDELASIVVVTVITSVFGPIILKNSYKSKKQKENCS